MKRHSLLLFLLLCVPSWVFGQAWSGIISPNRAVDWSNAGIPGGIPPRTTICATLNPGATASQISNAISSCPAGQAVFLNAGTYNLSTGITFNNKSNVTLRGAGANKTFLVFTGANSCHGTSADICLDSSDTNWRGGPSNSANWTAGYAKGTTVITLSSTANLAVGKTITLDQLDDTSDTGNIFVCENYSSTPAQSCSEDGPGGGGSGGQRTNRAQQQLVTVTAISGSNVTISPGLAMPNWSSSKSPGAWWATSPITRSGVENMSLDHTAAVPSSGVQFFNCNGCWVRGIRSLNPDRDHILMLQSNRSVVRDSYFYGTKDAQSQSYGLEIYPDSDALFENNIFQHITAPIVFNAACSGCVAAYNYSIDDVYTPSPSWLSHQVFLHAGGLDNVLIEGNVGAGMYGDLFHGSHHFITVFRNRYNGWETGKSSQTTPFPLWPKSRYFNIIGNVLGDVQRPHNNYEKAPGGSGTLDQSIFVLGSGATYSADDPLVKTTLMRWGNYDIVSNAAKFVASEVPSTLTSSANPVPSSNTLPASFYLPGKPAWFGSVAFPPIGPDVTGGNIASVGGHAHKIPAQLCYEAAPKVGNIATFNADNCYVTTGGGGGLTAPGSPSTTVH